MGKNGSVTEAVEPTVMAIREKLMHYFKGGYIDTVVENSNVRLHNLNRGTGYYFERHLAELKEAMLVYLSDVPILSVSKSPDTVVFHTGILGRSPQLREIQAQLERFFDDYLTAVRKEYDDATLTTF